MSNLYRKFSGAIKPEIKRQIKIYLEQLLGVGKREYFSQFGEDAVLQAWFISRAWQNSHDKHIPYFQNPKIEKGFYVDVGAFSPIRYSNTYWFYKRGWRGINIDATPGSMIGFNRIRPRDINIEVAISDQQDEFILFKFPRDGINTLSAKYAQEYEKRFDQKPIQIRIKTRRLDRILDEYLPENQSINFLTIDVEGYDLNVLRSNNWKKYHPELVIVEFHENNIEKILNSELSSLMYSLGYVLHSWVKPSLIWRRQN